jgi:hypothetical protein
MILQELCNSQIIFLVYIYDLSTFLNPARISLKPSWTTYFYAQLPFGKILTQTFKTIFYPSQLPITHEEEFLLIMDGS